ncbi:MAG: FAD-dependent oxidoreductase [Deltaproteobacteria bacterium]|nr:MAG: FAD-dependent oxidoreductase [Deltaproteobacteria bacterium]
MKYLILGSGPAGVMAAREIKKGEPDAEVTIATEEFASLYFRPNLPELIFGDLDEKSILSPVGKDVVEMGVKVEFGKRAKRVDTAKNRVLFTDGTEMEYNFLLIATGASPESPFPARIQSGSFFFLNSLTDAVRIRNRALRSDSALVYGPGYLGIETSRGLRMLGLQVTWINPGMPRFGNPISGEVEVKAKEILREKGVKILEGTEVADIIDRDGKSYVVYTTGGDVVEPTIVVIATERVPNIDFLEGSGIKTGNGVLVDEYLRTNVPNVFAAGDCAEILDVNRGVNRINFGWRSALKQGELAGQNMLGRDMMFIRNEKDYFGLLVGAHVLERWPKEG